MAQAFPEPVLGLYDGPMWESIRARGMRLQCCRACGAYRYPPGPACPKCLSLDYDWKPLKGTGTVISWVVFHRQYLPAYPAPYNVIAVQLDEGPIMISNLEGAPPDGSWVDRRVAMTYAEDGTGGVLPRFTLAA